MFSHYHLGTVSQGETRIVKKEIGEALVKLHLAEEVEMPDPEKPKAGGKGGNKRGSNGADKDASQG